MVRIGAVSDVHMHNESAGHLAPSLAKANEEADVFVLAGDLTLTGELREAEVLVREIAALTIPIVAVLGNHDCELDQDPAIAQLLRDHGVHVLEGEAYVVEVRGQTVGFAGTKGFCGGFQKYAVEPFGERALKDFVYAGRRESFILEQQLAAMRADFRVVVLHYAPIRETLLGEPLELYPFLGNSALARPVDKFGADLVVHGHAHYGSPFGRTPGGVPVYNVAKPVVHSYIVHVLDKPLQREPMGEREAEVLREPLAAGAHGQRSEQGPGGERLAKQHKDADGAGAQGKRTTSKERSKPGREKETEKEAGAGKDSH